jgi:hypothetical protein
LGGTVGNYAYPLETARQWLRGVLDAGGATGFDVFNYHDYKSWWTLPAHYDQYRALLDEYGLQATPIWVSETAQASVFSAANINPTYCSADGQAADIWRRPCLLFAKGAQTVFWHSYWDNSADTSGFRNMGLASADTGIRKKSWHSFRLLCQKIEGFASATLLAQGDGTDDNTSGGNGAWVVRFDFADGTRRWVAWSPNGSSLSLDGFSGVASLALTTVVPATLSTDGLTPGWSTSTATVHQGRLELGLADAPVLLEVATGYQAWAATHFSASELADSSVGAAEADPDGDGLSNLSEYALGGDPRVADSTALVPTCSLSTGADGHDHLTLTARLVAAATDLECSALVTGDLQTWQSGDGVVETLSDTVNGGVRTLVLRDREPVDNAGARRFMRLSVTAH